MKTYFVLVAFATSLVLAACADCPTTETYDGPTASPICGDDPINLRTCQAWQPNAIPYCYPPHAKVGPSPFPGCAIVTSDNPTSPPVDTDADGNASMWCCLYEVDGGDASAVDGGGN